jgi:hypothetical protein
MFIYFTGDCNPNNPGVILRFAILISSSDSADRGRSILRVSLLVAFSDLKMLISFPFFVCLSFVMSEA